MPDFVVFVYRKFKTVFDRRRSVVRRLGTAVRVHCNRTRAVCILVAYRELRVVGRRNGSNRNVEIEVLARRAVVRSELTARNSHFEVAVIERFFHMVSAVYESGNGFARAHYELGYVYAPCVNRKLDIALGRASALPLVVFRFESEFDVVSRSVLCGEHPVLDIVRACGVAVFGAVAGGHSDSAVSVRFGLDIESAVRNGVAYYVNEMIVAVVIHALRVSVELLAYGVVVRNALNKLFVRNVLRSKVSFGNVYSALFDYEIEVVTYCRSFVPCIVIEVGKHNGKIVSTVVSSFYFKSVVICVDTRIAVNARYASADVIGAERRGHTVGLAVGSRKGLPKLNAVRFGHVVEGKPKRNGHCARLESFAKRVVADNASRIGVDVGNLGRQNLALFDFDRENYGLLRELRIVGAQRFPAVLRRGFYAYGVNSRFHESNFAGLVADGSIE